MITERAIVKAILAYLNGQPGCLARKRWGGGMGVAGDPDIDACVPETNPVTNWFWRNRFWANAMGYQRVRFPSKQTGCGFRV